MKITTVASLLSVVLFSGAFLVLSGCRAPRDEKGGLGQNCGSAADCQDGLLCVAREIEDGAGACGSVESRDGGSVYLDPETGYEWQQTPLGGAMDWASAELHCRNLVLEGTGWRLPNIEELRSLFRGCPASEKGGACGATTECVTYDVCLKDCAGCVADAGPVGGCYWPDGLGGSCSWYWSSTSLDDGIGAWYVVFSYAHVCGRSKDFSFGLVRCIRR